MVRYFLPSVGKEVKLERRCPHCARRNGNIHSAVRYRAISDLRVSEIPQHRMKCPWCGTTWTVRAEGVGDGRWRSDRLRAHGLMLYMLGLSYRSVESVLLAMECRSGKSSVERDVSEAGVKAYELHRSSPRIRVRVLGVDGTGSAMAGVNRPGVLFFVDIGTQRVLCVEPVKETDAAAVRRHVHRVFAAMGSEELRTDELSVYEGIVPEERHGICLAHWCKSKGKRTHDLLRQAIREKRPLEMDTLRELQAILRLRPRPPTVPEELSRLVRRYINCRKGLLGQINQLLQHVERTWERVSSDPKDPTNNTTERAIGLTFKIRAKTMRGFKSQSKVLNHIHLANFMRPANGLCDLRKVI